MKTKTLLIAAATLAAGIISSQAAVYSQNVVGYMNVVTFNGSFNFTTCQVTNADGSNMVQNVLSPTMGNYVSGGSDINNPSTAQTTLWLPQSAGGYSQLFYYSSNDLYIANSGSPYGPDGWYDGNLTYATTTTLPLGYAFFIQNYSSHPITNTLVGTVAQGSITNAIHSGFNAIAYNVPLGGITLDNTNVSIPVYGDNAAETAWIWAGNGNPNVAWNQMYYYSAAYLASLDPNYVADGYVPGWYDGNSIYQGPGSPLLPKVGAGFYLQYPGPATNWVSSFIVQ